MLTAIRAERLFDGETAQSKRYQTVIVSDGLIDAIVEGDPALPSHAIQVDAPLAVPGFIDMQINGAGDRLFNDGPNADTLTVIAAGARKGGAAYILPTFISAEGDAYRQAIDAVEEAQERAVPGILGIHLEGPFLSRQRPGIHHAAAIRRIDKTDLVHLSTCWRGVRLITLAPEEQEPDVIAQLVEAGWIVFAGHSEATLSDMSRAAGEGLKGVTHLFNAMRQITPREPGVVGSVFADPRLFAGIIADGHHVHPVNLTLAASILGPDRLCLVTDAMPTLGGVLTRFALDGKDILLRAGKLTDADGTLAGAHLSMAAAVTNMVHLAGVSLADALCMASTTPAKVLGLSDQLGRIAPGMRAGLTLLDGQLNPKAVIVDGHIKDDQD